jgi:hypothetical protein
LQYFLRNSVDYLRQLQSDGLGAIFGLGIVGIGILCARKKTWIKGVFLATLVFPITLLYMFYFWPADRASMRFLMPTFSVYIIAGVWVLKMLWDKYREAAVTGTVILLAATAVWGLPDSWGHMKRLHDTNKSLAMVTDVLSSHIKPGNIVIAEQMINQHLDFIGRWRIADLSVVSFSNRMQERMFGDMPDRESGEENIPVPGQGIRSIVNRPDLMSFEEFTDQVRIWAGSDHYVYWLLSEDQFDDYLVQLPFWEDFTVIETFELTPLTMFGGMGGRAVGRQGPDMIGSQFAGRFNRRGSSVLRFGGLTGTRTYVLARWER